MARASWGVLRADRELMVFPAVSLVVAVLVSIGSGAAFDRLPAIIGYAAIAATVGMVLRYVSERTGLIGLAALALLGTTLQSVFTASVYRYAVTGEGGSMLPHATVQDAFRTTDQIGRGSDPAETSRQTGRPSSPSSATRTFSAGNS